MRSLLTAALLLGLAIPATAQHEGHHAAGGAFPDGWHGRVDRANQDIAQVAFMTMGDAFHVRTGPHVILWNPTRTAEGAYTASITVVHRSAPERLEGVGLFVGGRDLDQPTQDYLYFLMRHDGRYLIRHRAGDEVHDLVQWTEADAVNQPTADSGSSNTLAIEARPDRVVFRVNGTEVQSLQRVPMLNTDGIVGFRVGHHLDVHIQDFTIDPGA